MGEACDTGCEGTPYIGIDESHLSCLIVIFIVHILDQVQDVYIDSCQPVHHQVILMHHLVIIKILGGDRCVLRTSLHRLSVLCLVLLVFTAVDRVEQALRKVCACSEELHLFTCLGSGYAATDAVVIAPYRTHHIIILILDRGCVNGDLCRVLFEILRETGGVKYSQVRLRGRAHVL